MLRVWAIATTQNDSASASATLCTFLLYTFASRLQVESQVIAVCTRYAYAQGFFSFIVVQAQVSMLGVTFQKPSGAERALAALAVVRDSEACVQQRIQ